jgi:hypothetical protein
MLVSKFRRTQHSGDRKKVVQRSKFDPNIKPQRNAAGRVKSPGEAKRQNLSKRQKKHSLDDVGIHIYVWVGEMIYIYI